MPHPQPEPQALPNKSPHHDREEPYSFDQNPETSSADQ